MSDTATPAATPQSRQQEMPFAIVQGQPVTELPQDLYIPPDALEIILEAFEGPLDLLLYLIRRHNLNILDIPIADITHQYVSYIELMQEMRFELAAEYLVMAAILAEIKSRMLLPRPRLDEEADEEDPRAELVRRLQEYEQFKQAAEDIDGLPRMERDIRIANAHAEKKSTITVPPEVEMKEVLVALSEVLRRAELYTDHAVSLEPLSLRERMSRVLTGLKQNSYLQFQSLFRADEGRAGVIITFLAILELIKEHLVEVVQSEPLGQIYVKSL